MTSGETHHIERTIDVGPVHLFGVTPAVADKCREMKYPGEWWELVGPTRRLSYRTLDEFNIPEISAPVLLGPALWIADERDRRCARGPSL
jgi:hypothetical protein